MVNNSLHTDKQFHPSKRILRAPFYQPQLGLNRLLPPSRIQSRLFFACTIFGFYLVLFFGIAATAALGNTSADKFVFTGVVQTAYGHEASSDGATATDSEHIARQDARGGSNLSIGSSVFSDANDNGIFDSGEQGIPNVTLNLYNVSNTLVATVSTDISGTYHITGLSAGNYYLIIQNPPTGMPASSTISNSDDDQVDDDNNGDQPGGPGAPVISPIINLSSGAEPVGEVGVGGELDNANDSDGDMTIDFGFVPALSTVSIGSYIWEDSNQDGLQDSDEDGLEGITVALFDTNSGLPVVDDAGDAIVTVSDAAGEYLFEQLPPGNYYIVLRNLPEGYQATAQNAGSDDSMDSDLYANVAQTTPTGPLFDDDQYLDLDAGLFDEEAGALVDIDGQAWYDHDGDGIRGTDANEYGLANVAVTLYDINNAAPFETTGTDTDGNYSFTRIPAGQYYLEFSLLNDFLVPVWQNRGTDVALDSDIDRDRRTSAVTFVGGETVTGLDAGFSLAATLQVSFWDDTNQNGIRESNEASLSGALVTLQDTSGTGLMSIATDSSGFGTFVVPPGSYQLQFTPPDGYIFSPERLAGGIDNDADSDGLTQVISLFPSDNSSGWDAGVYRLGPSSLEDGTEPDAPVGWLYLPLVQ